MKRLFVLAILMSGLLLNMSAFAQDVADPDEITEEELEKFAAMEDSVASFYESKNAEFQDRIRNNEVIEGGARFSAIRSAWGNEEKMEEINVTEEEVVAYQELLDFMENLANDVRTLKTDIIKDSDLLGVSTYNKINNAMKADPALKARVDNKIAERKEQRENDETDAGGTDAR